MFRVPGVVSAPADDKSAVDDVLDVLGPNKQVSGEGYRELKKQADEEDLGAFRAYLEGWATGDHLKVQGWPLVPACVANMRPALYDV